MAKVVLLLLVLLCFLLMPRHSYGHKANRKVLSGIEVMKLAVEKGAGKYEEKQDQLNDDLRVAPMGPDPMHHYGAPPRKPETRP